jgi:hypothetical protein
MMDNLVYVDRPHTGGWILEVRKGALHVGNIRKNRVTGRYQFFRGSRNAIRPMLEESDLEALKQRIEEAEI